MKYRMRRRMHYSLRLPLSTPPTHFSLLLLPTLLLPLLISQVLQVICCHLTVIGISMNISTSTALTTWISLSPLPPSPLPILLLKTPLLQLFVFLARCTFHPMSLPQHSQTAPFVAPHPQSYPSMAVRVTIHPALPFIAPHPQSYPSTTVRVTIHPAPHLLFQAVENPTSAKRPFQAIEFPGYLMLCRPTQTT